MDVHRYYSLLYVIGLVTSGYAYFIQIQESSEGIFINRSHGNLTRFPSDLPQNVNGIDVSHNAIEQIIIEQHLKNLTYLDVSYNVISGLKNDTFIRVPNLRRLFLNHNSLKFDQGYPEEVFAPLKELKILHLHNNDVTNKGDYPENSITKLTTVEELRIDTFPNTSFGFGFAHMKSLKKLLLGFENCQLKYLRDEIFINFTDIDVEMLDLDQCPVCYIERNVFHPLKSLQQLILSNTGYLGLPNAVLSISSFGGRNITSITFERLLPFDIHKDQDLSVFYLGENITALFKNVCIQTLSLRHNRLLWFSYTDWSDSLFANCIQRLDLSGNDLYGNVRLLLELKYFRHLKYFDLSRHAFGRSPHLDHRQFSDRSGKRSLQSADFPQLSYTMPKTLQYLNISGLSSYGIPYFRGIKFEGASSLKEFRFTWNGVWNFNKRIVGLTNISLLDISGNTCGNMLSNFFEDFPRLETLNMSEASLNRPNDYLVKNSTGLFQPLTNLKTLILRRNDLPFINRQIFKRNTNLESLVLSHNRFKDVPCDILANSRLTYLDLSFNSLTVIKQDDKDAVDVFGSKLTIDLTGNLLSCNCQNLDMVTWLYKSQAKFLNLETYTCIREDGTLTSISEIRRSFDREWRRCIGVVCLAVSFASLTIFVVLMPFVYLIGQRKTLVLNAMLRVFGFGSVIRKKSRKDFTFDVFIGNSDRDNSFVLSTVSNHLEVKHKLEVFVPERDVLPGRSIPQEIIKAVDSSWRVVLILSQAFLEDNWCRFIADYAVYVSTFRPGCVILVLFDDVRIGNICPSLLNVVDEEHIYRVREYRREQLLWKEISETIKTE